jgi:uncharacterized protein YgbK (DUF1537 family)
MKTLNMPKAKPSCVREISLAEAEGILADAYDDRQDTIKELMNEERLLSALYEKEDESAGAVTSKDFETAIQARDEALDDLIAAEFAFRRAQRRAMSTASGNPPLVRTGNALTDTAM